MKPGVYRLYPCGGFGKDETSLVVVILEPDGGNNGRVFTARKLGSETDAHQCRALSNALPYRVYRADCKQICDQVVATN